MSDSLSSDNFLLSPDYAYLKANVAYFQPALFPRSEELFRELKRQQELFKDQFQLSALDIPFEVRGNRNFSEALKKGPVIFVSYHMGPVGTLLRYIANLNIDLTLLFDTAYYEKWGDRYLEIYREFLEKNKSNQFFQIINAETLEAGLKIAKALMKGSSLLLLIDGNSGTGGARRQDEKLSRVDFFGRKIVTRRGLAYLSRKFNAPVVSVASYYEINNLSYKYFLEFSEPKLPSVSVDDAASDASISQHLFGDLERFVQRYPDQWAGWLYAHNFIEKLEAEEKDVQVESADLLSPIQFNSRRYSFIFHDGNYFLFNHSNYKSQAITPDVYTYLARFEKPQIVGSNVSPDSILQLLKQGILVKA